MSFVLAHWLPNLAEEILFCDDLLGSLLNLNEVFIAGDYALALSLSISSCFNFGRS